MYSEFKCSSNKSSIRTGGCRRPSAVKIKQVAAPPIYVDSALLQTCLKQTCIPKKQTNPRPSTSCHDWFLPTKKSCAKFILETVIGGFQKSSVVISLLSFTVHLKNILWRG